MTAIADPAGPPRPGGRDSFAGRIGTVGRRSREVVDVVQRDGVRRIAGRVLARGAEQLLAGTDPFDLAARHDDIVAPTTVIPYDWSPAHSGPLRINWVTNPIGESSGGMSTLMRTIALLEDRGHDCHIYVLYKGIRRDLERDRQIAAQRFPNVRAPIDDLSVEMRPADAAFATAWPTAFALRASSSPAVPFYLVQDFEPSFYAVSTNSVLAEDTYRFGFHGITAGRWLAHKLWHDYRMTCDSFDLGVDLSCYEFRETGRREGVVFYARPDTPRRGYELGVLALELFARRHPEMTVHLIGQDVAPRRAAFRYVNHGHLPPEGLAEVYNQCAAGLVLSLTNISLLPAELMATGCIPVLNDADNTRDSFDNRHAQFAATDPVSLAEALCAVVEEPNADVRRRHAAASVGDLGWERAGDQLESGIRRGLALWERTRA